MGGIGKVYPAHFFCEIICVFFKNLIVGCIFLALAGSATSSDALSPGVMEGHLKILSSKPVDIGDENAATVTAGNYADYPLLISERPDLLSTGQIDALDVYHALKRHGLY